MRSTKRAAGVAQTPELDAEFLYPAEAPTKVDGGIESPDLVLAERRQRLLAAEAGTKSRRVPPKPKRRAAG